jgi:hypothetical protein
MSGESFPHRQHETIQASLADQRAQITAHNAAYRKEAMDEANRFGEQFPEIAEPLREHAERKIRDFEAQGSPERPRLPAAERAEKMKADRWEFLTILAQAVPDLPIVEIHDEDSAEIDATFRDAEEQSRAIREATKKAKSDMGDVLIDDYLERKQQEDETT